MVERACVDCGLTVQLPVGSAQCPSCGRVLLKEAALGRASAGLIDLDAGTITSLPPPEVEAAARDPQNRFDQYVLVEEAGRGGAGTVHRAWDLEQKRFVALKILKAGYKELEARSIREAHSATLLSHPNIVKIHRSGSFAGWRFIAMELVAGRTLDDVVTASDAPPLRDRIRMFQTVCAAIQHAHSRGVVHRDLKPKNILVDAEGHPYVVDFGIARPMEPGWTVTMPDEAIGTPSFMSPEQVVGGAPAAAPATDVYSLGATLYFILAGQHPFDGTTAHEVMERVLRDPPAPPSSVVAGVPTDLEVICLKCMEKDPAQRYASAQELADDVGRWLHGEPLRARPVSRITRLWRKGLSHRRVVMSGAAVAALAIAIGGLLFVNARRQAMKEEALKHLETAGIVLDKAVRGLYSDRATPEEVGLNAAEARRLVDLAIDKAPDLAQAHYALGRAWEIEGWYDRAEASWRKSVELDPEFAPARLRLGTIIILRGLHENTDGWELDGERIVDADAAGAARRAREAAGHLARAVALEAGLEDPLQRAISRAWVAWLRDDRAEAEKLAHDGIHEFKGMPGLEEMHLIAGLSANPPKIPHFDEAIALRPKFPFALYRRGMAHGAAGDDDRALKDYTEAVRVNPRLQAAHNNRGVILMERRRYSEAVASLTEALRTGPAVEAIHANRAFAYFKLGALDKAAADVEEALKLDPSCAAALTIRGMIRFQKGDADGAMADYEASLAINSKVVATYIARAQVHERRGRLDLAIADCARAIDLSPRRSDAWRNRGQYREASGDLAGAATDYDRAVELASRDPYALAARSNLRGRQGNLAGAIDDLQKALDFAPPGSEFRAMLEEALKVNIRRVER